jgi:hypothetical protein
MSRQKSLARLRAILESVTLLAVATAGTAHAAAAPPTASPSLAAPGKVHLDDDELAHRLAAYLTELPPIDAAGASAELATSPDVDERAALAEALAWVFPLATDDVLIDHLADDPAPRVRAAVARAAWARRAVLGDTGVVRRLLGDADPTVRAAAWQAVKR